MTHEQIKEILMDFAQLGPDIAELIMEKKYKQEHEYKFSKCLKQIKRVHFCINDLYSKLDLDGNISYFGNSGRFLYIFSKGTSLALFDQFKNRYVYETWTIENDEEVLEQVDFDDEFTEQFYEDVLDLEVLFIQTNIRLIMIDYALNPQDLENRLIIGNHHQHLILT